MRSIFTTVAVVQSAVQRSHGIPLPHNSLLAMGLATNSRWIPSVLTDKRPEITKDPASGECGSCISHLPAPLAFRVL
jgi:hypothetical protein